METKTVTPLALRPFGLSDENATTLDPLDRRDLERFKNKLDLDEIGEPKDRSEHIMLVDALWEIHHTRGVESKKKLIAKKNYNRLAKSYNEQYFKTFKLL